MSDDSLDVLIAVYLIPDLAKQDFDGLVKLVEDKTVSTDGVADERITGIFAPCARTTAMSRA